MLYCKLHGMGALFVSINSSTPDIFGKSRLKKKKKNPTQKTLESHCKNYLYTEEEMHPADFCNDQDMHRPHHSLFWLCWVFFASRFLCFALVEGWEECVFHKAVSSSSPKSPTSRECLSGSLRTTLLTERLSESRELMEALL